jgi:hypothetical protein
MRIRYALVLILVVSGTAGAQQPTLTIDSALVARQRSEVSLAFSRNVEPTGPHTDKAHVRVRNAPGVAIGTIKRSLLELNVLDVILLNELPVGRPVDICFDRVRFLVGTVAHETTAEVCRLLGTEAELAAERAAVLKALSSTPKAARDKTIFASGFVTAASDKSSGGADISLNPDFKVPNLNAFLQIKKATVDKGDAKHFETGARYRYTATWRPEQVRLMSETPPGPALNDLLRERQSNTLAGTLLDVAAKLEGDPTNFSVTNFVGETAFQLSTMTKGFLGRTGFWRGFVLPAGVEVGQSLGLTVQTATAAPPDATATKPVNRIARYKAGAGFTMYYDNPGAQLPLRRVELDVNGVLRQLFLTESRFNADTKKVDTTTKGLHPYGQVDLKVFIGESTAGRYGFKLSFNRGRLPPVYAQVNSLQFGFVIESVDDDAQATADRKATTSGSPASK